MPTVLPFERRRREKPQAEEATLGKILQDYLAFLEARRRTTSLRGARSAFRRKSISKALAMPCSMITRRMLEDLHRDDEFPIAANRCLQWVRAAWTNAELRGFVPPDSNPLKKLGNFAFPEAPRATIVPPGAMTTLLDEIARQRSTAGHVGPIQPDAVLLILLTGMRKGEVEALTWDDVKPGRLELPTSKSGKPRMVPLSTAAEEVLGARRYREPGTKVFHGIDLRRTWDGIRHKAGIPEVTLHDLRRTFAVAMLGSGKVDLADVAKVLGHKSTRITSSVYTPLAINRARAIAELGAAAILDKEP